MIGQFTSWDTKRNRHNLAVAIHTNTCIWKLGCIPSCSFCPMDVNEDMSGESPGQGIGSMSHSECTLSIIISFTIYYFNQSVSIIISSYILHFAGVWVIPCQLIHFFADPSPILMKFGKLGGQQKKLIHTKFQHISTIFNGVRAL